MDEHVLTGIYVVWTVVAIFSYLCLGKKSWSLIKHYELSGHAAEMFERMQVRAVRSFSTQRMVQTGIHVIRMDDTLVWCAFGWNDTSSWRLMLLDSWASGRYSTSFDGWQGTEFFDLQTVQNLLETLLNSGIPVKKHHYKELILSNRMRPISN